MQWYTCKDCVKTFNDKTGTVLHYRHISLGNWMAALWLFLCGPLNGVSIRFISQVTERVCKTTYYMMRDIREQIHNLSEKPLKGTYDTDKAYFKAGSKGVLLDTNGEGRTVPSRRGLPHRPQLQHVRKEQVDVHHILPASRGG